MVIYSSFPMRSIQFYQHVVRCLILEWIRSYKAVKTMNSQPKQLNLTFIYFRHCFLSDTFIYTRERLQDWGLGLENSHLFLSHFLLVFSRKKKKYSVEHIFWHWLIADFLNQRVILFFRYRSSNEEKTICT